MADKDDWGYLNRRDQPDRLIPVPPQAVPQSEWPRGVAEAVRNPQAAVSHYQILFAMQADRTRLLSQADLRSSASGGGGSGVNTEQTWYARPARFCRTTVRTHTTGAFGFTEERIGFDYSLFSMISTSAVGAPWVIRFEDVISAELAGSGTISGAIQFGLRQNTGVGPTVQAPNIPFIGFYCIMNAVGYGTWITSVCADSGGSAQETNTGITSELPHRLTCDINAQTGTITFYIDGVQVAEVTGFAGTLTHTTDDGALSWMVLNGGTGVHSSVCTMGYWMDLQANTGLRLLDLVA